MKKYKEYGLILLVIISGYILIPQSIGDIFTISYAIGIIVGMVIRELEKR